MHPTRAKILLERIERLAGSWKTLVNYLPDQNLPPLLLSYRLHRSTRLINLSLHRLFFALCLCPRLLQLPQTFGARRLISRNTSNWWCFHLFFHRRREARHADVRHTTPRRRRRSNTIKDDDNVDKDARDIGNDTSDSCEDELAADNQLRRVHRA